MSAGSDREAASRARRGAILVIEDRDDVRQGLTQLLELHGFLVMDARDGEEAMQQLATDPAAYALVLLDLMLPGPLDGQQFRARQLRDPALAAVPTIVMTASDLRDEERAQLRADAWLTKPFRFDDLLDLIRRYVVTEGSALQAD